MIKVKINGSKNYISKRNISIIECGYSNQYKNHYIEFHLNNVDIRLLNSNKSFIKSFGKNKMIRDIAFWYYSKIL